MVTEKERAAKTTVRLPPPGQPVNVDQLVTDIRKAKGLPAKSTAPKTPQKHMSAEEIAAKKERRAAQRQVVLDNRMDTIRVTRTDASGRTITTSATIPHGSIKTPPPKPVMTLEEIEAENRIRDDINSMAKRLRALHHFGRFN